MTEPKDRIIAALDVETESDARSLIAELNGRVGAFKIGLQLFTAAGPGFVREIVESGNRVFLDLKFHDIPNTVAKAAVEAARLGVWMFNVHAIGGSEMMSRAAGEMTEVCEREGLARPKLIAVTVLTSSDANGLRETGIESDVGKQVIRLARLAQESGLDGVVASPLESSMIRENVGDKGFLIVTPGIRPAFATNDDQKRVTTPGEALSNGSDYIVIGRPITAAKDKADAVNRICEEIETACQ